VVLFSVLRVFDLLCWCFCCLLVFCGSGLALCSGFYVCCWSAFMALLFPFYLALPVCFVSVCDAYAMLSSSIKGGWCIDCTCCNSLFIFLAF
jgi:hypothetical protein